MKLVFGLLVSSEGVFGKEPSFYDEFDDLSNWIVHNVPDSYNNEYQYYTDRNVNVRTEDGYLKITPLREKYQHRDYTSAKVTSKYHQTYGRVEVRAKQPNGRGIWPAIWMMPQDESTYGWWPASGEIDIYEGRGQNPTELQSAIHFGANNSQGDNHDSIGSGRRNMNTDMTDSFHRYRVDWTPTELKFYFDDHPYFQIDLNRNLQEGFYDQNGQPFDHDFYLILNVAVGGDFLAGPDPWDEWNYPDGEMWVDWVKFWTLDDLTDDLPDDLDYECRANPDSSIEELCGSANWACFNQQHVQMTVCDDDYKQCCQRWGCNHQQTVDQCTRVFHAYDSQIHDGESCDFSGNAVKDWIGDNGTCQGNRNNYNNASFCGSLSWVCGNDQTAVDLSSECSQRKTTACCNFDPKSCSHNDLISDADLCYDPYYQVVSPNGPNIQHCDFDGTGNIVFD